MSIVLGANFIVNALEKTGAKLAFGIPGGAIAGIFHSLSVSKSIRVVLCQHESAAGFMAMGSYLFSRSREIPIVFTTSGPGAVNAITGVAAAFEERVPLIVLTANVATSLKGKRAAQDSFETGINISRMYSSITAKSVTLESLERIEDFILGLHSVALQSSVPVHIDIPGDVSMKVISSGRVAQREQNQITAQGEISGT